MALVEITPPATFTSAYRPICWDILNTTVGVVKVQVQHKIDGVLVATTVHLPVLGTTDSFLINGSNIASNFVTYDIADVYRGVNVTFDSEKTYELVVDGLDVTGSSLVQITSTATSIQNIPLQHKDNQNITTLELTDVNSCALSKRPTTSTIYRGEFVPFSFFSNTPSIDLFKLDTYNNGSPVSGVSGGFAERTTNRMVQYVDTSNAFYDAADEIRFQVFTDGSFTTPLSKQYRLRIKENCNDFCEVHFLNCLGSFDSFVFTGDKETKSIVKRKKFSQSINKGFSVSDRGQSVLGTKATKEVILFSRFLNAGESEMLSDLIHSPEVYIIEDDQFCPVVVKDGSFTTNTTSGLIQYKVVLQYSNNKIVACV